MTPSEIRAVVDGFLDLLEGTTDEATRELELREYLDALAHAYHSAKRVPDAEAEHLVTEPRDHRAEMDRMRKVFPMLASYPVIFDVDRAREDAKDVVLADPADDLADLRADLTHVRDVWDRQGEAAALNVFAEQFEFHWGLHLRHLQDYLHHRAFYTWDGDDRV